MIGDFFSSFTLFEILFVIVFILAVITIIYRIAKGWNPEQQEARATVIKEREIIREIVKIRCPYCNNLYDETEDKRQTVEEKGHSPTKIFSLKRFFQLLLQVQRTYLKASFLLRVFFLRQMF